MTFEPGARTRTRRTGLFALAAAALALTLGAGAGRAHADGATCRVRGIVPSDGAGGIDERLADIRTILANLRVWRSYALVSDQTVELPARARSAPLPLPLPQGKVAELTYLGWLPAHPNRLHIRLQLVIRPQRPGARPDVSTTFLLDDGGTVLQMLDLGQSKLLVAETCRTLGP